MADAQRFFASLERFSRPNETSPQRTMVSSSLYGCGRRSEVSGSYRVNEDETHSHHFTFGPLGADLFADKDVPLDGFDQELLSEQFSERQWQAEQSLARISVPPKSSRPMYGRTSLTTMKDDTTSAWPHSMSSSSSSTGMRSSSTVAALQNRVPQIKRKSRSTIQPNSSVLPPPTATPSDLGHAVPIVQGIQLVPATHLPDRFRSIFPHPIFNAVQSRCFPTAFGSDNNLVVSAPTGSGKTVIMELAICQLMSTCKAGDFKIVYQAPTKSLCAERHRDWHVKFGALDLHCAELTGDTEYKQLHTVQSANIIVTTPEKWDSVTRKWKDNARLMEMIKLFLIDEVHVLKESRGATLEAVVSRMKSARSKVRFIALSATIPNSEDIAEWLGKSTDAQHLPAHREVFGEEFRPVRLQKIVKGFPSSGNDYAFESQLNKEIPNIIARYSQRKPTMIFCFTRSSAIRLSGQLANLWYGTSKSCRLWHGPENEIRVMDAELLKTIPTGVAFHHAGLDGADRRAVEQGFMSGNIKIICCTSTLAVGVNLPCYLVVLKGTVGWSDHGAQEYPDLEIMQMLGRAGRPQFESSACAVILTRDHKVRRYERMIAGEELLESCLHRNLVDHLNAEIGLGTVYDLQSAKTWLAGTFLCVRLQHNPQHYQLKEDTPCNSEDELLEQLCEKEIKLLREINLIPQQGRLESTGFGDAMARSYVRYETMKIITALPPKAKTSEILSVLAQAAEFRDLRLKSGEKSLYKDFNGCNSIKFPIKVDIALPAHKVSLLIQTELGACPFPTSEGMKKHQPQYRIDKAIVFSHIHRLIRCVIDCQIQLKDSVSARHALELGRSIAARVWDNSSMQLKQIEGVGDVGMCKLASAGIKDIETLENTEAHRIETILNRNPPLGSQILASVALFPSLRVSVKQIGKTREPGRFVEIKFNADIGFLNENPPQFFRRKPVWVCFLAETSHGNIIDFRRFAAKKLLRGLDIPLSAKLIQPTTSINCYVMCDEIAGTSKYAELKLEEFPASFFPPIQFRKAVIGTSMNSKQQARGSQNRVEADFSDGDLDDCDLLAAALHREMIEVIEDIDELMADKEVSTKPKKPSRKRAASQISADADADADEDEDEDEDSEVTTFREPQLLENGRWTCQHDCIEKNKTCKHKCCKEGVPKRKKAPGKKHEKQADPPATKNKDGAKTSLKKPKSPFETGQNGFEERKRKEKKRDAKRNKFDDSEDESPGFTNRFGDSQRKKRLDLKGEGLGGGLTFEQNPYGFATDSQGNTWSANLHQTESVDETDMFGYQSVLLEPDAGRYEMRDNEDDPMANEPTPDTSWEKPSVSTEQITRHDDENAQSTMTPELEDDLWPAAQDDDDQFTSGFILPETPDEIPSDFFDSDVDLGGFDAPLSHVSLGDVEKRSRQPRVNRNNSREKSIFITGESASCSQKTVRRTGQVRRQVDAAPVDGPAAKFGLEGFENNLPSPPKSQYLTAESSVLNMPPTLQEYCKAGFETKPGLDKNDKHTMNNSAPLETNAEHEERLKEEEQRKKWEGIDPELYEMLKDCVELI